MPSRPPSLMLPVDVLELIIGQIIVLCFNRHWIPLTRVPGPGFNGRAELFRELRFKPVRVQRVDKEANEREICEG